MGAGSAGWASVGGLSFIGNQLSSHPRCLVARDTRNPNPLVFRASFVCSEGGNRGKFERRHRTGRSNF